MLSVSHTRRQHGVGQGGFHSASVEARQGGEHFRYDYIYDCGALDKGMPTTALLQHIDEYRPRAQGAGVHVVDAMVLSHFDYDHMNGAEIIAICHRVERIFVPALTPELLALEIARQSATLSAFHLASLFQIAHHASLWGRPLVRIVRGNDAPPAGGGGQDRPLAPGRREPDAGAPGPGSYPRPMSTVDANTGQALGAVVHHATPIALMVGGDEIWRFKFWCQDVSDELVFYVLGMMSAISFPFDQVEKPNGATAVTAWLAVKARRDALVDAYRRGYELFLGKKLSGKMNSGFANYISMAMFSGPAQAPWWPHRLRLYLGGRGACEAPAKFPGGPVHMCFQTSICGWLGTGDAMLGEPATWADFAAHFVDELPVVLTVLLPHHGAAPKAGARFYHRGLSQRSRINVLSFGYANGYGHPARSVLRAVAGASCICVKVNELTAAPYYEESFQRA